MIARSFCFRALVSLSALLAFGDLPTASAQEAPVGGHHGNRGADSGFRSGSVSPIGGFSASVPMSFPPARGGLPIPVAATYGGSPRVGEMGVGWAVPHSYVTVASTFTRSRPGISNDWSEPHAPLPRVTLVMDGQVTPMVWDGAAGQSYRPLTDAPGLELRRESAEAWIVFDGNGRRFRFERDPRLGNPSLWLLASIHDRTGENRVVLDYAVEAVALPDGNTAPQLLLSHVAYNFHPTFGCPKHVVRLDYEEPPAGAPSPLSIEVESDALRATRQVLGGIDVLSVAGDTCAGGLRRLRRYQFEYELDADSRLPRLAAANVLGQEGTSEEYVSLPLGRYTYGSASSDGALTYRDAGTIPMPAGALPGLGQSEGVDRAATQQVIRDFTGDGLPDLLVDLPGGGVGPVLYPNFTASTGGTSFTALPGANLTPYGSDLPVEYVQAHGPRHSYPGPVNVNETWVQAIDFNGDGRIDIVDARSEDFWVVHINEPGPTPGSIEWTPVKVSIAPVRDVLEAQLGWQMKRLPLAYSVTGVPHFRNPTCMRYQEGSGWNSTALSHCLEHVDPDDLPDWLTQRPRGAGITGYLWKLADANGDGFPDIVANSRAFGLRGHDTCGDLPDDGPYTNGTVEPCWMDYRVGFEEADAHNDVVVFYNNAGVRLRQAVPFSGPVVLPGAGASCAVEQWRGEHGIVEMTCGLLDANGDGILDRKVRSDVYLGTGERFATRLALPGPGVRFRDTRWSCTEGVTTYTRGHTDLLVDLTGDGIPDYLRQKGAGWEVLVGTGVGWSDTPLSTNVFPGATRETCDEHTSLTVSALYDIDGDGRPDLLRREENEDIQVMRLEGPDGRLGAHSAGRLVRIDNGFGASTHIEYGSAKSLRGDHSGLPFPEIVVTRVHTTTADQPGVEHLAVEHVYGRGELQFHPLLDRWIFPGYQRRLAFEIEGTMGSRGRVRRLGRAVAVDTTPAAMLPEGHARYALTGKPVAVHHLHGLFDADLWQELALDPATDSRVHGGTSNEYAFGEAVAATLPPELASIDCTDLSHPRDFAKSAFTGSVYEALCGTAGFAYPAVTSSWTGRPPSSGTTARIATRSRISQVDDYGRPLVTHHERDVARVDDDICELVQYAEDVSPMTRNLDAVSVRRFARPRAGSRGSRLTCDGASAFIAGLRYRYDGLPEGQVHRGLPSEILVERYDPVAAELLEEYVASQLVYDAHGNVVERVSFRAPGAEAATTWFEYAPAGFALAPDAVTTTARDQDGQELALRTIYEVDPVTLAVRSVTDPNGARGITYYDGFGRAIAEGVAEPSADGAAILQATDYIDIPGEGGTRQIVHRRFHAPVSELDYFGPLGASGVSVTQAVTPLDPLGRPRYTEIYLGSDYGGAILRTGESTYDRFGRVVAIAHDYTDDEASKPRYGTRYQYRVNGELSCEIVGPIDPEVAGERYRTCHETVYAAGLARYRTRGPRELAAGTPQTGAYDEVVATAVGWVIETARVQGGQARDVTTRQYDLLGQLVGLRRYGDPAARSRVALWQMRTDSLGRPMWLEEAGAPRRSFEHDWWGNQTAVTWTEGSLERRLGAEHDGFGRLVREYEATDGVVPGPSVVQHFYDQPSSDPRHVGASYLLGRASYSVAGGSQSVFFGYDGLGRAAVVNRVGDENLAYTQTLEYSPDGRLQAMGFRLPDTGHALEEVVYTYDSALRVVGIDWVDDRGAEAVFTARSVDPFGRYRDVLLGNGAVERNVYRSDARRELQYGTVETASGLAGRYYRAYDEDLRVLEEVVAGPNRPIYAIEHEYDSMYRLSRSEKGPYWGSGASQAQETFAYDGLGNLAAVHAGLNTVLVTARTDDPDKICSIWRPMQGTSGQCSYDYDAQGNVVRIAEPNRPLRRFDYDGYGRIGSMQRSGLVASFRYDAEGAVSQVDIHGGGPHQRSDRRYGPYIEAAMFPADGISTRIIERRIPGPDGVIAVRRGHGASATTLYLHGTAAANEIFTDETGAIIQDVETRPFGGIRSEVGMPGSVRSSKHIWNGGDTLRPFGVTHIGARIYDAELGRFLQRDPLLIPRASTRTHPYAFAWSDPVNLVDPSGLDPQPASNGGQCYGPEICGNDWWLNDTPWTFTDGVHWMFWARLQEEKIKVDLDRQLAAGLRYSAAEREQRLRLLAHVQRFRHWDLGPSRAEKYLAGIGGVVTGVYDDLTFGQYSRLLGNDWANYVDGGELGEIYGKARTYTETGMTVATIGNPKTAIKNALEVAGNVRNAVRRGGSRSSAQGNVPRSCFVAGTLVWTPDGAAPIEELQVGDFVLARDEASGEYRYDEVANTFVRHGVPIIEVAAIEPNGTRHLVETTAEHPFWVEGQGWVRVEELEPGRLLLAYNGTAPILTSITSTERVAVVYNIEVVESNTYFVGELGAWVHNKAMGVDGGSKRLPNRLEPHPTAQGPHTSFRRDPQSGRVTNYETYEVNPRTGGFVPERRFRGEGRPHGGQEPPLILERRPGKGPGSSPVVPRPPTPGELPSGY